MNEKRKGSLLLPLGIGAGLLLLAMSKKQATAASSEPLPEGSLLPAIDPASAATPQMVPEQAPSYADAVATTQADDAEQKQMPEESDEQEEGIEENSYEEDESEDYEASRSSGGGSYTPYQPKSSINTNKHRTEYHPGGKPVMRNRGKMNLPQIRRMQPLPRNLGKKPSMRSDIKPLPANTLYVGNGKPSMRTDIRPGAITVNTSAKAIKQSALLTPVVKAMVQTSIFPLKFGMKNNPYVKELQKKLGVSATGHFNSATRNKLHKKYGVKEVPETLYKQIITGQALMAAKKPAPKLLSKLKKLLPKRKAVIKK